jgi:predicted metalloendopeptidase
VERWTARSEIDAVTRRQVATLLSDANHAPAGSLARMVADYRAAWLDSAGIQARGLTPIRPLLDSIDQVHDKVTLTQLLGRWMKADADPLNWGIYRSSTILGLAVEPGINGEGVNLAFLVQGGLGLPDREHYVSADPAMQVLREKYQAYIAQLLTLAGYEHGVHKAPLVLALETAIARTQVTREASANDRNADSAWTRADFARRAPGMDWSLYFDAAGLGSQETFIAWQPSAVTGLAALVASESLDRWKDYLRFQVLHQYADLLPPGFAEQARLLGEAVSGKPDAATRADRATAATQSALGEAIGRLYAERYFPAARKRRVETIVANVKAAFARRVEALPWMSSASKAVALAKLDSLYFELGYPERWEDWSSLRINRNDPIGNARRVAALQLQRSLARLGQPVDRRQWWMNAQAVAAILIFQQNSYNFPAALLQAPKFDAAASDAANYGAIGAIAGHEISHYVDLLGADWDATGRMRHWWTEAETSRFGALAQRLVDQYAGYKPFSDLVVDGERTRSENVADLGGLTAAFDAYRRSLGDRAGDAALVRRLDREFFIGFARSWRSRYEENAMRAYLAADHHAPDRYRIATVRNLDAWYEAFDVKPGQALYLAPADRVKIW